MKNTKLGLRTEEISQKYAKRIDSQFMPRDFSMKADAGTAEILVYEEIGEGWFGGLGAKAFAEELTALGPLSTINLRINSPGGDVFEGVAIYNTLANHPAKVNVFIDGLAASIASVVAMAGDTIAIAENAMMMIHNPWALAMGESKDMVKMAELLDKIKETMVGTYAQRTGQDAKAVSDIMDAETWLTGQEAVDQGFADSVIPVKQQEKKAAKVGTEEIAALVADAPLSDEQFQRAGLHR